MENEHLRTRLAREELADRIDRIAPADGETDPLLDLTLFRFPKSSDFVLGVYEPSICVIAQGRKEVALEGTRYAYDPFHYLVNTVELPVASRIAAASPARPYLALRLKLDPAVVGAVMAEAGPVAPEGGADLRGIDASPLDPGLLDAVLRLVRTLDAPADVRVLAPAIRREIVYRLLTGAQGARLRHIAVLDGNAHRIARAIERLRKGFDRPLRVEDIAHEVGMSPSSFHHHFKTVTSLSPIQYQKRLRLHEARRLMLGAGLDASEAGLRVGYDDKSQFSREYKRLFGAPPMRDVERLRRGAAPNLGRVPAIQGLP